MIRSSLCQCTYVWMCGLVCYPWCIVMVMSCRVTEVTLYLSFRDWYVLLQITSFVCRWQWELKIQRRFKALGVHVWGLFSFLKLCGLESYVCMLSLGVYIASSVVTTEPSSLYGVVPLYLCQCFFFVTFLLQIRAGLQYTFIIRIELKPQILHLLEFFFTKACNLLYFLCNLHPSKATTPFTYHTVKIIWMYVKKCIIYLFFVLPQGGDNVS